MRNIRFRDQYDWVVLGDHPGALLSAAMAARQGQSVLVIGLETHPSSKFALSSYASHASKMKGRLLEFSPNYYLGLGESGGIRGLLAECLHLLGISSEEWSSRVKSDHSLQILTPELRCGFSKQAAQLGRELKRELGEQQAEGLGLVGALKAAQKPVLDFWNRFYHHPNLSKRLVRTIGEPGREPDRRAELKKAAALLSKEERRWLQTGAMQTEGSQDLSEVYRGIWYGTLGQELKDFDPVDLVFALALSQTAGSFRGGLQAWKKFLQDLARKQGAHVARESVCRRIFVEDGVVKGIQASEQGKSHGSMIVARGALLGVALDHAREHISASHAKWQKQMKNSPQPDSWRFTVSVKVHAEAIPPAAGERMIWSEPDAPPMEVEIADPASFGHSEEKGQKILFLRTQLPFTQESLQSSYQRLIAARMLRQLIDLMPFIEYHIIEIYPDFRKGENEFLEAYGFATPVMIPDYLRTITQSSAGYFAGIEGLFLATDESYPLLGSMGPVVAAVESTAWIAEKTGVKGPLPQL